MNRTRNNKHAGLLTVGFPLLAALTGGAPASAQLTHWNVPSGSWFTGSNWDLGTVPTGSNIVFVGNGGTCNLGGAQFANAFDMKVFGNSTLDIIEGALLDIGDYVIVGSDSAPGTLRLSAGQMDTTGAVFWVGDGSNSPGLLDINAGFLNSSDVSIGRNFQGSGSATVRNTGRWDATSLDVGFYGQGLLEISSGAIIRIPTITIANQVLSTGTLRVTGNSGHPDVQTTVIQGGQGYDAVVEFMHGMTNYGFAPQLQGSLRVVHGSTGSTLLTGTNSYEGGTTLLGGVLIVSGDANLGSGAVTFDGGTLRTTADTTINRQFSLQGGNGTIDVTGGTLTYTSLVNGPGMMAKIGAGTLAFDGFANMNNELRLLGGTTNVGGDINATGIRIGDTGSATVGVSGGFVQPRDFLIVGDNLDGFGAGANGTLTIGNGGYVRMDSAGNAPLTIGGINGTGTVNLNTGGTLQVRGVDAIRKQASGTANFNFAGGTLVAVNQDTTSSLPITLSGASIVDGADNTITLSGPLTGSGGLTKSGANRLVLSSGGTNYAGTTNILEGTLEIASNINFNSPINIAAGANLTMNIASDVRLFGNIVGDGSIAVAGNVRTARLSGDDSLFSGSFTLPNGTRGMMWNNPNAGSAAAEWDLNGQFAMIETPGAADIHLGALSGTNPATQIAAFTGTGAKQLVVGGLNSDTAFAGQIKDISTFGGGGTGTVGLTKVGTGTLTLSNGNTYTGGTTVNAGALCVTGSVLNTTVNANGVICGTGTLNGPTVINAGGALAPAAGPGQITATGPVTLNGMLLIDIAGPTPVFGHDVLLSSGSGVTIGARANLMFGAVSGTFSLSDKLFILNNAGTLSGTFAGLPDGGANGTVVPALSGLGGFEWRIFYGADQATNSLTGGNDVALAPVIATPCPGDLDGDQQVALTDLTILLANFGVASGAAADHGDLDGDGDVDLADLSQMLSLFGSVCP